jgi:hypothetical protein
VEWVDSINEGADNTNSLEYESYDSR